MWYNAYINWFFDVFNKEEITLPKYPQQIVIQFNIHELLKNVKLPYNIHTWDYNYKLYLNNNYSLI